MVPISIPTIMTSSSSPMVFTNNSTGISQLMKNV
eukprot:CAMPEP_0194397710 /NCGR_PEP_ID=MMETSP0174-20130528/125695_1 /TAXON_ID=216777 /ORGANISM="Proboscia alata, Strain PI-D3" /LENGTH=33 /DNA_ID= /DNA_START= /DNA_END= /DNA_ORIENTATION=